MNREPVTPTRRFERPHHKLDIWNKAMGLAEQVYQLTRSFPADEKYGLVLQMRRAAVSIVSNLAEGAARRTNKELEQFLHIAQGSLSELEAQFELAERLGLVNQWARDLVNDVARMLSGLVRYARNRRADGVTREAVRYPG